MQSNEKTLSHLLNLIAMFVFDKDQDVRLQFLAQTHFIASTKDALDLGRFTWSASVEQAIGRPIINQSTNQSIDKSIENSVQKSVDQWINQ